MSSMASFCDSFPFLRASSRPLSIELLTCAALRAPAPAPPVEFSKWTEKEQARFCAKLGDMGLEYDAVAAYCESIKRPRPSVMGEERRAQLLAYLGGAADIVAGLQGAE